MFMPAGVAAGPQGIEKYWGIRFEMNYYIDFLAFLGKLPWGRRGFEVPRAKKF